MMLKKEIHASDYECNRPCRTKKNKNEINEIRIRKKDHDIICCS